MAKPALQCETGGLLYRDESELHSLADRRLLYIRNTLLSQVGLPVLTMSFLFNSIPTLNFVTKNQEMASTTTAEDRIRTPAEAGT